jgi:hypothetical protein
MTANCAEVQWMTLRKGEGPGSRRLPKLEMRDYERVVPSRRNVNNAPQLYDLDAAPRRSCIVNASLRLSAETFSGMKETAMLAKRKANCRRTKGPKG